MGRFNTGTMTVAIFAVLFGLVVLCLASRDGS